MMSQVNSQAVLNHQFSSSELLTACGRAGAEGNGGRPAGRQTWWWVRPEEDGWRPGGSGMQWEPALEFQGRSCSWGIQRMATVKECGGTAPVLWGRSGCRRSCSPGKGRWALPLWGWAETAAPGWAGGRPGGRRTAGPVWTDRGTRVRMRLKDHFINWLVEQKIFFYSVC